MSLISRLILALAATAVLAGCAGTNFKRPDPGVLEVGKSTSEQVVQVMGAPTQSGEALRNGQPLKVHRYAYAEGAGTGKYPGVVPARAMVFLTHNGLLVAEEFVSSFPQDATDFDESKIPSIVKGKTTRAQLADLLGRPNGRGIYPFVKTSGDSADIYSYSQAKGSAFNMKFYSKTLIVTFNPQGLVSEVEYTASGEK